LDFRFLLEPAEDLCDNQTVQVDRHPLQTKSYYLRQYQSVMFENLNK